METQRIVVDRNQARALYRKYKEHQHWAEPIDREIQRTYQLIAQGRVVIKALESIRVAGVDEQGRPKLAIMRADQTRCRAELWCDGSLRFLPTGQWGARDSARVFNFPAGTLPRRSAHASLDAIIPIVPIHLRPKRALANYHILWEADWRAVPADPVLLRRIGKADLWLVLAAWDLTEVERAALA